MKKYILILYRYTDNNYEPVCTKILNDAEVFGFINDERNKDQDDRESFTIHELTKPMLDWRSSPVKDQP